MLMTVANALTGVLSNSAVAGIRTSREAEIELTTKGCEAIVDLIDKSTGQLQIYQIERGRLLLLEASEAARTTGCRFLEAAAGAELALIGTRNSTNGTILHFLNEVRELMVQDISDLKDRLMDMRAKRAIAAPLLDPREALLELVEGNIQQYNLLERSANLRQIKERADTALVQRDWVLGERLTSVGLQSAIGVFGQQHWWAGLMRFRLGTALIGLKKPAEARLQIRSAQQVLLEWVLDPDTSPFAVEMELLKIAVNSLA